MDPTRCAVAGITLLVVLAWLARLARRLVR